MIEFKLLNPPKVITTSPITTPTLVNPQANTTPSFIKNLITGNFTFNVLTVNLPSITVVIGQNGISFTGCNTITVYTQALAGGIFKVTSAVSSTKNVCSNNTDLKYVQVLQTANGFVNDLNNVNLTSANRKVA